MNTHPTNHPSPNGAAQPSANPLLRTRSGLLDQLTRIDTEGWDGLAARELLDYVKADLVTPLAAGMGLSGPRLDQAISTGWATAWEQLADPRTRDADSPWGRVWSAVRWAIHTEITTARNLTDPRRARRRRTVTGTVAGAVAGDDLRLVSLTRLAESGWEPTQPAAADPGPGRYLSPVIDALVDAGWQRPLVTDLVLALAGRERHRLETGNRIRGEVATATQFAVPRWRVRRLQHLLHGVEGWPGIVEQLASGGPAVLDQPGNRAAIRVTNRRDWFSPELAARHGRVA